MAVLECKCGSKRFYTSRSIQIDVELDENGEHIKDLAYGDYYDNLGENIITCTKCKKEVIMSYEE